MRDYKKALVAGALAMSMLVGQAGNTDITATAKTKYNNEIDLFDDTGEVVGFYDKFDTKYMRSTQKHFLKGSEDGYYFISNETYVDVSSTIPILDNTNSVKKVTVDGKKSYKLNNPKVSKNKLYTYYDFGDNSLHDLGVKAKSSSKLKYSTLSEGKHTLSIKDKHGHEVTYKVWKDTKAPKFKVTKKGNKVTVKVTDKGTKIKSIDIGGKKKEFTKAKKSVTVTVTKKKFRWNSCSATDRAGNTGSYYE